MQIKRTNRVNLIVFAIGLLGLGLLWLQHVPTGVTLNGWHSFILVLFFYSGLCFKRRPTSDIITRYGRFTWCHWRHTSANTLFILRLKSSMASTIRVFLSPLGSSEPAWQTTCLYAH